MAYVYTGRGFGALPGAAAQQIQVGQTALSATLMGGPLAGAIAAGVAEIGVAINALMNSGCGQTCIVSSNFANQAEQALQANINAYFSIPTPRPLSAQKKALAAFDQFWAWLQQNCSNPQLGSAGQRCITDRQAGACKWRQPASSVPPWGTPPAGACWNWFNGYRDPIAADTNVYDDSVPAVFAGTSGSLPTATAVFGGGSSSSSGAGFAAPSSSLLPLLLIGGLLAVAVAV